MANSSIPFIENTSFSLLNCLHPVCGGEFLDSIFCLTYLCVLQNHTVLISVALQEYLKLCSVNQPIMLFLKLFWLFQLLCLHIILESVCYLQKCCWNYEKDYTESVDMFGEKLHGNDIGPSNP